MDTSLTLVPDLSYEAEYSVAHEEKEVMINGARIMFDRKVALMPVEIETDKKKKDAGK